MNIIHNFAVFEGGDGSGTSTQLDLLKKRFAAPEMPLLPHLYTTFEPTDSPIGALIRSALRGDLSLQKETIAGLFAADRNEHLYGWEGILEQCRRDQLVVSDRYTPSSLVYQEIDCGAELPARLNASFPGPELLLFFDLDPEIALERIRCRPGRDIYEYREFQFKVRDAYKALLPRYAAGGVRVEVIDASRPPEEVAEAVWRAIEKMPIVGGRA
jgi:dTMP kinase